MAAPTPPLVANGVPPQAVVVSLWTASARVSVSQICSPTPAHISSFTATEIAEWRQMRMRTLHKRLKILARQ